MANNPNPSLKENEPKENTLSQVQGGNFSSDSGYVSPALVHKMENKRTEVAQTEKKWPRANK